MTDPSDSGNDLKQAALEYHRLDPPGKIRISATKPMVTQRDLALAYSPGVAYASVFGFEAALVVLSAVLAWQVGKPVKQHAPTTKAKPISFSLASNS